MSIFNRKKTSFDKTPASGDNNEATIKSAIVALKRGYSAERMQMLAKALCPCVEGGDWVPMVGKDCGSKGFLMDYRLRGDLAYGAFFTDRKEIKQVKDGFNVIDTDINKLIDPVFRNPNFGGIVINPDTDSLFLEKKLLLKILLHSQLPTQRNPGVGQKDWGIGIPHYNASDIMTEAEFLNFAMHTVLNYECGENGYDLVSANDNVQACPNLILQKSNKYVFVAVKGYCAEDEPQIDPKIKARLLAYGEKYHAQRCYATVGFGSTDAVRFDAWLALRGDGFYAKYLGLQAL